MEGMLHDRFDRPLGSLRISVTDRCNLRCLYCMPEDEYVWLPREDLLSFEEIARLVSLFGELGVTRIRLTGGEPLLRRHLSDLVQRLASCPTLEDLALTTNGVLFAPQAAALQAAGLRRVTVSLDTLRQERFRALARLDRHGDVLDGIAAARALFGGLKIDTVVMRGINDDELVELLEFGRQMNAEVRFIEYMDVGGATRWQSDLVVSRAEILERLARHYGSITHLDEISSAPARRFRIDGLTFGIIASTTEPFCSTCDRARLTADGMLLLCLYATSGTDLRGPLRQGASDAELREIITSAWHGRIDRGAEQRLALPDRSTLVPVDELRRAPHLEMHTRGG
ncbi:MAG: GTP 3',8-cyclase MoaA [Luteitalea sp.]|nr:GTP 3',8-cyclase MoaA [Luteitalea sp.]